MNKFSRGDIVIRRYKQTYLLDYQEDAEWTGRLLKAQDFHKLKYSTWKTVEQIKAINKQVIIYKKLSYFWRCVLPTMAKGHKSQNLENV